MQEDNFKFIFLFNKRNIVKETKEKKLTKQKNLADSIIYYKNECLDFSDLDYDNDNLEITLCFISSNETLTTYKTTIFKVKDFYKQALEKNSTELDTILTLSGNTLLTLQFTFPYTQVSEIRKEKKAQRSSVVSVSNELTQQHLDFVSSINKVSTAVCSSAIDSDYAPQKQNDSNTGSLFIDSEKKNDSPVLIGSKGKPPLHKKNSASQLSKLTKEGNRNDSKFNEPKPTAFKVVSSPEKISKRKSTNMNIESNPGSTNNSMLINLINCQPANSVDFIELSYEDYTEYSVGTHLAEAVFIAGLSESNLKIVADSEKMESACKHPECSKLYAYKPELLAKFPAKGRSELQLNNQLASLCFSRGLKPCFSLNEKKIPIIEDYLNVISNEAGTFYQYSYHFYCKYDCILFNKKYSYFTELLSNLNITPDILKSVEEFTVRDYVYLPYCICVISKFPMTTQLNACLTSLVKVIFSENDCNQKSLNLNNLGPQLLTQFLKHITYELPIPTKEELNCKKLKFYIPFNSKPIEFSFENSKEIPQLSYNMSLLFDYLSIENLTVILNLMLTESKMLFVAKSALTLSKVIECLKMIIYPMGWVHIYIPVMSDEAIKFLQFFQPFIIGLEEALLFMAKEHLDNHEDIYLINIDKQTIENSGLKPKKITKKNLKSIIGEFDLLEYEKLECSLKEVLEQHVTAAKEKKEINEDAVNLVILKVFCSYQYNIFGDYQKYLSFIDDYACFSSELFLSNKPQKYHNYYRFIIETQNFSYFIENHPQNHELFNKLSIRNPAARISKVRSSGILSIFSKTKVLDLNVKDITVNNPIENNRSSLNSSLISGDNPNSSKIVSPESSITELYVPPFFLTTSLLDLEKIEESISEMNFSEQNRVYSFTRLSSVLEQINNYNEDQDIFRRVIIPKDSSEVLLVKRSNPKEVAKTRKSNLFKQQNQTATNKETEKMCEKIRDFMRKILTSQILSDHEVKSSSLFFQSKACRKCIASLIHQEKFQNHVKHQLSEKGFELMSQIICNFLVYSDFSINDQIEDIIRITKSCFQYYKIGEKGKEQIFLHREIMKKQLKFWESEELWLRWYEVEIKEIKIDDHSKINDHFISKLCIIFSFMRDLGLDIQFIQTCLNKLAKKYIKDEASIKEFLSSIKKWHKIHTQK